MRRAYLRIPVLLLGGVTLLTLLGIYALACSYVYLEPSLPSVSAMRSVELQVPLRVYTRSGDLIAQIGEQRRIPATYDQIPTLVKEAFLAAEDDRFFQHHGIDYQGLLRAAVVDVVSGERAQGASTITQQAARRLFLTLDKTWRRKLEEAFLTYRMEHEFSKQEIFALYLNVVFFGERAYGVGAAAETFFGKPLDQLTVAEAATLAGIVQLPSRYNPIANPQFAKARRTYVLRRMRELGYIDPATAAAANAEPVVARAHTPLYSIDAQYVAEMARLELRKRFGPQAETAGYKVYTTIDGRLQAAANRAVRLGLIEYDRRYGYRGPVGHADLQESAEGSELEAVLDEYPAMGLLTPAVVTGVAERAAQVYVKGYGHEVIAWDGLSWARRSLDQGESVGPALKDAAEAVSRGDIVYVVTDGHHGAQLVQVPEAQAALVSLDPNDGAVAALVGGFDYFANKYNRATQAKRQPGSGFKPFLYSAALEDGFTPASVLLDAPIVMDSPDLETVWRPENSHHDFRGPMRLREALVWSRNLVSIRLLRQMTTTYAIDYVTRFGFDRDSLPNNLTLALGTLQVTPLELAGGYATFANGGFRVQPYFIDRIVGPSGQVVWQAQPQLACDECDKPADLSKVAFSGSGGEALAAADALHGGSDLPAAERAPRVISPQNDYLMTDMMADVIKRGTGQRAMALGRTDLAGKTGTTNYARDAWFNGFNMDLVTTVWVGYDQERPLGETEEGSRTALPIWVYFMREALKGVPQRRRPMPDGLITLRVAADTGLLVSAENPNSVLETFMTNHLPAGGTVAADGTTTQTSEQQTQSGDSLF